MAGLRFNCIVFTLLLLYTSTVSPQEIKGRDENICFVPWESNGPVPPVLPESFTLKATKVDILGKTFAWIEEYFDVDNERAKYVLILNGDEINMLFDFRAQEVVTYVNYRPGGSASQDNPLADLDCKVQSLSDSEAYYFMPYRRDGNGRQSRMYSSNQVLSYGGPHLFAYLSNSTDKERGLPVYSFKGCVYNDDFDETMESTYHWTEMNQAVSASGVEKMPVKIQNKGKIYILGSKTADADGYDKVEENLDIIWFDDNKAMPESIFQIPPRMQCSYHKRRGQLTKPSLPNFFSTRMEIASMTENWEGKTGKITYDWYEELWYDYDLNLVRLDFVPSDAQGADIKDIFPNSPVSAVYDFNTGVVHYTEKTFRKCVIKKIPKNDFLVTIRSQNLPVAELAKTNAIFGLDAETITYKGKYVVRDIKAVAWAGLHNRTTAGGTQREVYREFYVSGAEWHADYDDEEYFQIPLRDTSIVNSFEDGQAAKTITEVNFFKFKPSKPHQSSYDISGCLSFYKRRFFQFELPGDKEDDISHHHDIFLDELKLAIVNTADVGTSTRVQELEVLYMATKDVHAYQVSFSLLEVPSETSEVSMPKKGVDLETAVNNLKTNFMGFSVTFKSKAETVTVSAVSGSLKELSAKSSEFVNMRSPSFQSGENNDYFKEVPVLTSYLGHQIMYAPSKEEKPQPKGYTPGALAGLAISMLIIGTAAGIVAMIFYNKKKMRSETDRLPLS